MMVLFHLVAFIGASHGQDATHHFQGCSRSDYASQPYLTEKVTHDVCSSMCYQADYSLYMMKSSLCLCTEWNLTFYDGDSDCKDRCKDDLNKYCGTDEVGAVYSVCGKLSWGHGCQMNCMCESEFCDIVEGRCTTGKCMPGFRGERCDWWDETLLKGLWSLTIRSYLKEALDLGIISKTGEYLSPIHKTCPAGLYGRACTMKCHCFNSSECIQATGLCPPEGCQPGWVGKRCDREAPCDPPKCINGGKCIIKTPTTYLCQCPQTLVGVHCEYRNPCLSSPCQNRGTCFNVGLFFKCQCAHKFAGEVCDIVVPDSWTTDASTQLLGCYRNLLNVAMNLDLRTLVDHKFMDMDRCVTFCRGKYYTFAGIEEGSICYCANMFIFNQFGAVWHQECNSTCSGQLPSSASECGGEGLVTVYTTCPMNGWGQNCNEMCKCAAGQCDIMTGLCRRPGICQFGWTGGRCDGELSIIDKMQSFPCIVLSVCLAVLLICLPLLAFYYLMHMPSEEFEKLAKLAELEFDVDEDLKRAKKILKKMRRAHDNGRE